MAALSTHSAGGSRQSRAPRASQARASALAQRAVRGHAADERERLVTRRVERRLGALDQLPHDRGLVARGEIGAHRGEPFAEVAHGVEQRRLEAREREIVAALTAQDVRERERPGVTVARQRLERRTAGVAQAEQPCALVEGLARGVVARAAEADRRRVVGDVEHERVPAGGEHACERRRERERGEPQCRDVAEQVIDRDERQAARIRERLARREPDEQRPDQPGSLRHRDRVDRIERRTRVGERRLEHRHDELEVAPRGDLGHDAAEAGVEIGLRGADARAHLAGAGDDGRARVVAGGLEREDHQPARPAGGSRHMIRASSRLSV